MQISLKLSRAQKHTKLTLHIKFQPLMIFSSSFIGASVLPVFARSILYPLRQYVRPSVRSSVHPSAHPPVCPSVRPSISPSVHPAFVHELTYAAFIAHCYAKIYDWSGGRGERRREPLSEEERPIYEIQDTRYERYEEGK